MRGRPPRPALPAATQHLPSTALSSRRGPVPGPAPRTPVPSPALLWVRGGPEVEGEIPEYYCQ
jgi:hypothetical protein